MKVNKQEWLYRIGYEKKPYPIKPSWWQWILFWWIIDTMYFEYKNFADFIDKEGNIRRVYIKQEINR